MSGPPSLRQLAFGIVAFVTDEPGGAIVLAARQLRGSSSYVLCISPPATRGAVLAAGARWSNLTVAEEATAKWASRYRHSSSNAAAYERFCLRRWLMLHEAVARMPDVGPATALAVLDSDVLLFRHPALWLSELQALPQHRDAHAAGLFGVAFMILSPEALGRFAGFLRWLYGGSSARLGAELDRFGVPRTLLELPTRSRRTLNKKLVAYANQTSPGHYRHFTDVQAMRGFCARSNESSLPKEVRPVRCSGIGFGNRCADPACRGADADIRTRVEQPEQPYHRQVGGSCSTEYLAPAAPGSVVMYTVETAPWPNAEGGGGAGQAGAQLARAERTRAWEAPAGAVGAGAAGVGGRATAVIADASGAVASGADGADAGRALSTRAVPEGLLLAGRVATNSARPGSARPGSARAGSIAGGSVADSAAASSAAGPWSGPPVRHRPPPPVSPSGAGLPNASMAGRWASSLRWSAGHWLVPGSAGQMHRLCLAHMQGPQAKAGFMQMLAAGPGAGGNGLRSEEGRVRGAGGAAEMVQLHGDSHGARARREEAKHHHHHSPGYDGYGTRHGTAAVSGQGLLLHEPGARQAHTHALRAHAHEHGAVVKEPRLRADFEKIG